MLIFSVKSLITYEMKSKCLNNEIQNTVSIPIDSKIKYENLKSVLMHLFNVNIKGIV